MRRRPSPTSSPPSSLTPEPKARLLTCGHGRPPAAGVAPLLTSAGVTQLVDIRRFPHSRHNPDAQGEAIALMCAEHAIAYRWDERLGGRRHLNREADARSPDTWWQVASFRAYAAHTRTPEFADAMNELLAEAPRGRVAIMCSETVWWRCHRRLIADVTELSFGVGVVHLLPGNRREAHRISDGARLLPEGGLVWDGSGA